MTKIQTTRRARPLLLLGYGDSAFAAQVSRHFRRHGWEVRQTSRGHHVRDLANSLAPDIVVLDVDLPGQSGWLTAVKLRLDRPGQKILLIGDGRSTGAENLATFVEVDGYFNRQEGPLPFCESILGSSGAAVA